MTSPDVGRYEQHTAPAGTDPELVRTAAGLVDMMLSAWSEPEQERRRAVLDSCCVPEVSYVNLLAEATGTAAVAELLGRLTAQFPGVRPVRSSALDFHHRYARFEWVIQNEAGQPLLQGLDVIVLSEEHDRIASVITFFGAVNRTATYTYGVPAYGAP